MTSDAQCATLGLGHITLGRIGKATPKLNVHGYRGNPKHGQHEMEGSVPKLRVFRSCGHLTLDRLCENQMIGTPPTCPHRSVKPNADRTEVVDLCPICLALNGGLG